MRDAVEKRMVIKGMRAALVTLAVAASLAACATTPQYAARGGGRSAAPVGVGKVGRPYQINGKWYTPQYQPRYNEVGIASWYGPGHQGKPTANGERFDMNRISAAHKTLPLPSLVEVTNLDNGKRLKVRVNDRGPFVDGRIIDLSRSAAKELGFEGKGVARVRVKYLGVDRAAVEPYEDITALAQVEPQDMIAEQP